MSIARINSFAVKSEAEAEALELLVGVVQLLRETDGCVQVELLQNEDATAEFVILERWTDREAHRRAAAAIPADLMTRMMALVSEPPKGSYYVTR